MRCGALRCNGMRCIALRCIALRCAALRCGALRCAAHRCVALQCVALRCIALRCPALRSAAQLRCVSLPCVAMRCHALPCVAMRCHALPCVAMRCKHVVFVHLCLCIHSSNPSSVQYPLALRRTWTYFIHTPRHSAEKPADGLLHYEETTPNGSIWYSSESFISGLSVRLLGPVLASLGLQARRPA